MTVHCLSSDSEPPSPTHSTASSSSVSSFDEANILPTCVPRPRPSTPSPTPVPSHSPSLKPSVISTPADPSPSGVRKPQPPKQSLPASVSKTISFLKAKPKVKPDVGMLLSSFEKEIHVWISSLKENCTNSQSPLEPELLWSKFRKRFDSIASNLQDIYCKDALENLLQSINKKVRFLKDVPEHESYTGFAERFAAAEAAEKSFIKTVFAQIDEELYAAYMSEKQLVIIPEKTASEHHEDMEIDYVPSSSVIKFLDEIRREIEEMKSRQDAEKLELKAWMAKQEEATAELQKTAADLQKTFVEIKDWMVKQDESSSKIENLLKLILAKNP